MSDIMKQIQEENTTKLVMNTYYKVMKDDGATAEEIAKHLHDQYGDVWKLTTLTEKAESTLQETAALGFLRKHGDRYVAELARSMCCSQPQRGCCKKRRRRRRRRRRSCRGRRRRRRRGRPCCCK